MSSISSVSLPAPKRRPPRLFAVARRAQTYRNLLYILLAFPSGIAYFWLLSLWAYILDGNPLVFLITLVLIFAAFWYVAVFERWLGLALLRVEIAPMSAPMPEVISLVSLWERIKAHIRNPVTWKSLVFLLLKLPLGFASLLLLTALLTFTLALIFMPAVYLLVTYFDATMWQHGYVWFNNQSMTVHDIIALSPFGRFITGRVEPGPLALSFTITLVGLLVFMGMLNVSNGLAAGWGWLARRTLGLSVRDVQLAEARALAIRERARAESADRSRRDLIVNASHELRTPVATLRAHIESLLLLEGERLSESVRSYLGITLREAERLSTLVDDLLMLARADSDHLRLNITPVDAGAVVEEVFQAMEPLARREREITLTREIAPNLPPILADRDRLAQVLMNLIRNAITFTPRGGIVALALAPGNPGTLVLTVTDTGEGIAPDDLEHVFERFYRTDSARASAAGGSGLGLAIVRDLISAMGGTVAAELAAEGGTRMRIILQTTVARNRA